MTPFGGKDFCGSKELIPVWSFNLHTLYVYQKKCNRLKNIENPNYFSFWFGLFKIKNDCSEESGSRYHTVKEETGKCRSFPQLGIVWIYERLNSLGLDSVYYDIKLALHLFLNAYCLVCFLSSWGHRALLKLYASYLWSAICFALLSHLWWSSPEFAWKWTQSLLVCSVSEFEMSLHTCPKQTEYEKNRTYRLKWT